jgi:hypothetical protein
MHELAYVNKTLWYKNTKFNTTTIKYYDLSTSVSV